MTTAVAAGLQASVVTAHRRGELVKGGAAGSGPTSAYLSRSVWRINSPKKHFFGFRVRRVMRCEASGGQVGRMAEEARRSAGEAARSIGKKADQVFDGVKRKAVEFQDKSDVQSKARRAAENVNLKLDAFKTEIASRLGIDEPLSQYMEKKGKEIRSEMVGTAESVYSSVVAISNKPVVKRSLIGFLLFYAFSIVWAARILLFDKKSEEAREQFGRELRLQKLREGAGSAPTVRTPLDYTEMNVNGRKVPSANDKEFRDKVRKIQEMARAVRVAEQEVFVPSESGFVSISGKGPVPEPEKQQSSIPTNGKDFDLKKRKQRKQMPVEIQDKVVGLANNVSVEKLIDGVAGNELAKLVHEPEPPMSTEPLKPVVVKAETPSAIGSEDTKNVGVSETLQSNVVNEDSNSARSTDAQVPFKGDVVPSLNGSAKASTDGKPTPLASGEVKLPRNGNATPNIIGVARPVPRVSSQPQKFKSMRVITSPEEARARIAARKAKDGSSSVKGSSANSVRPKFPKIKMPAVESTVDELGTDSEYKEKDKDSVGAAGDQSFKGNKVNSKSSSSQKERQQPKSDEQQEEEAWMRDEVLRSIVLKVFDNEEAGRDSFHGLDSEEEQKFFKGLERKFEREGEAVKTWIHNRVENLDYGLGGVGVDDPPESFMPRWKDPENPNAKRFEKFQEDRKRILEQQMGISTPSQTDRTSSASTSSSSSPSPAPKPSPKSSSSSPSSASTASSNDISNKDESRERLQSNGNASGSKTIVTSTGKQAKPAPREWQHTKKWAQELQKKYNLESDPEQRAMIEEVGQDLDRWITEDEIDEAQRMLSKGLAGEQEYVKMHYEKTREKIKKQHEMFGSQGMLNKYSEYKETKKEVELWWLDLPFLCCIGLTNSSDDGEASQGFYSLDMTPDFAGMVTQGGQTPTYNHTIAFQDPKDASNFCGLLLSERHMADVVPIAPKDLYQDAKQEGFKVTVIKKGQLGLVPGQALDDVEQRLIELGSSIYWEELERARSIDIDAVLDEGLGYGRPSR